MQEWFSVTKKLIIVAGIGLLAACGGKGKDSTPTSSAAVEPPPVFLPTTTVSGVYDGSITDTGQAATALLQADGSFYMVYSGSNGMPLGAVVGTGTLSNGSFASTNTKDLSLVGSGTQTSISAPISASVVQGQTVKGTIAYPAPKNTVAFSTSIDKNFSQLPSLADLAGTYTGAIATASVKEDQIQLSIDSAGNISGKLSCGCKISATLSKAADNSSYVISLLFIGGEHVLSNKSMSGNVYYDTLRRRIYIIGSVAGSDQGLFVGTK